MNSTCICDAIPTDQWSAAEAARRIARGDVCYIDANIVSTANERLASVNLISWGLVGNAGVEAERFRWLGPGRYDIMAVWGVLKAKGWACEITFDDEKGNMQTVKEELLTAFVNSTQYFGKGLRATPAARLDDGKMDLVFMKSAGAGRGKLLAVFNQLPTGAHQTNKDLIIKQCTTCTMNVGGPG